MTTRTFKIVAEGESSDAERAAQKTAKAYGDAENKVTRHFRGMGAAAGAAGATIFKGLGIVALGGVLALGKGLSDAFTAAKESAKIGKQTEQVIKTMGASSWTSSQRVGDLAGRIANLTGVDDELIQSGANLVLTFGNIRNAAGKGNDIFDRTVGLANDMSVALGQDMSASSIQLGKALNDPVKGVTALQRVGVSFTQGQRDQIAAMVDANNTLGAQRLILGEVEKQFGGTAAAVATPWDRLKVTLGNVQEWLGERLIPVVDRVVGWLADRLPGAIAIGVRWFNNIKNGVSDFWTALTTGMTNDEGGTWFENLALAIHPVVTGLADLVSGVRSFIAANPGPTFAALAVIVGGVLLAGVVALKLAVVSMVSPFVVVIGVIAGVAAGAVYAYQNFEGFRRVVDGVVTWVRGTAIPWLQQLWANIVEGAQRLIAIAAPYIAQLVSFITEQFGNLRAFVGEVWPQIQEAIGHVIETIKIIVTVAIGILVVAWRTFGDDIIRYAQSAWDFVQSIIQAAVQIVSGIIRFALALINGDWSAAWEAVKTILSGAWDFIMAVVRMAVATLQFVIGAALGLLKDTWGLAWGGIRDAAFWVWETIKSTANTAVTWVKDKVIDIVVALSQRWSEIWNAISEAPGNALEWAKGVAVGAINGLVGIMNSLIRGVNRVLSWIPGVSDDAIPEIGQITTASGGSGGFRPSTTTGRQLAAGGDIPVLDRRHMGPHMTNGPVAIAGEGRRQYPEYVIPTDPQYGGRARALVAAAASKVGLFAAGGVIGDAWGAVTGVAGGIADAIRQGTAMAIFGPVHRAVEASLNAIPNAMLRGMGKYANDRFYQWVKGQDERAAAASTQATGGPSGALGLVGAALAALPAFRSAFPGMTIGGRAPRSTPSDHPEGKAMDLMTTSGAIASRIINMFMGQAGRKYWIWNRQIASATSGWIPRSYNGPSPHTDHVHLSYYKRGGVIPFHNGGTLPEDIYGVGPSGQRYALQQGERVTRRGGGGEVVVHVAEGAIQITVTGASDAEAARAGRTAGQAFMDTLAERRVLTTARIR
jgi:hypothetical protein